MGSRLADRRNLEGEARGMIAPKILQQIALPSRFGAAGLSCVSERLFHPLTFSAEPLVILPPKSG
jgi:hypothetical protein